MLEITNLRNGAVLNSQAGIETADFLEITVQGIASAQAHVTVNGQEAERCDRNFSCQVRLRERINHIAVKAVDYYGERTQQITVMWDKCSFKRCSFFFDDCIFFLRWIVQNRPESIFEEHFLCRLKSIHEKYGSKFLLNLFAFDDHHRDFSITDFPDDYREEFQRNSDWLKLSFHAKSEFPDRPYQNASGEVLAADYDMIYNEVCRFAGKESFMPPLVIHWAMTHPENFAVLKERGTRCLLAPFIGSKTSLTEAHSFAVTDIGFHYEKDVAEYISRKHIFYDSFHDLVLHDNLLCCNYDSQEEISNKFAELAQLSLDTVSLMTHEQYSYSDYFNYIPDHLDRIELACKLASEAGCKPVFFSQGLLGNTSWDE